MRRDGARPGDLVLVSGTLGDAALGRLPGAPAALARRQRRPVPRLALGLGLRRVATAAIDLSDGLAQDLGHLCLASGVGATLYAARLPRSAAPGGTPRRRSPTRWGRRCAAARTTSSASPCRRAGWRRPARAAARAGVALTLVGEVTRRRGVRVMGPDGRPLPAAPGFDHLAPAR